MTTENHEELRRNIESGGAEKYHEKNKEKGKMFVRDRLKELLDDDLDVEDAFLPTVWTDHFRQMVLSLALEK